MIQSRQLDPTEADAFHAAILAAPLDDAPWLIYADWLDEQSTHEPAAKIRRWINAVKPAAIEAWERGGDRNLSGAARTLQAIPGEWWRLAAVLGQRLTLERRPLNLDALQWKNGWGPKRFEHTLGQTRLVVEQFAFGLADWQQLGRMRELAHSVSWAADSVSWAAHSVSWAADSVSARSAACSAHSAACSAEYSEVRQRFTALYRAVAEAVR